MAGFSLEKEIASRIEKGREILELLVSSWIAAHAFLFAWYAENNGVPTDEQSAENVWQDALSRRVIKAENLKAAQDFLKAQKDFLKNDWIPEEAKADLAKLVTEMEAKIADGKTGPKNLGTTSEWHSALTWAIANRVGKADGKAFSHGKGRPNSDLLELYRGNKDAKPAAIVAAVAQSPLRMLPPETTK